MPTKRIIIGRGRLTWHGSERRSDRYGYVFLINSGDSLTQGTDYARMIVCPEHLNKRAQLVALVAETRKSTHIGDLFRGVFPVTPEVGEEIVLGVGLLVIDGSYRRVQRVGLKPFDDDRETMWMDIHALYRCHEQTVELSYLPLEPEDAE